MEVMKMYGCQQELIKIPESISFLEYLCTTANKLMSSQRLASARRGIYWARQWYFKLGYITGNYNLEKELKSNRNYQFLYSQVELFARWRSTQQTLRGVAEAFKSYKELCSKYNKGELADKPQLPKYRKKGGMGVITYPCASFKTRKR
jgi:hypothetical protein